MFILIILYYVILYYIIILIDPPKTAQPGGVRYYKTFVGQGVAKC